MEEDFQGLKYTLLLELSILEIYPGLSVWLVKGLYKCVWVCMCVGVFEQEKKILLGIGNGPPFVACKFSRL